MSELAGDLDRPRAGMLRAVEDEIAEVRRRLGPLATLELRLRDGALVEAIPGAYLYRFKCQSLDARPSEEGARRFEIPEDTTGVLESEGRLVPAAVLRHDPTARELTLELQLSAPLPRALGVLSFSTVWLLEGLRQRLKEQADEAAQAARGGAPDSPVEAALAGRALELGDACPPLPPGLGADQAAAVRRAFAHGVSFVWGPPGTGKTRTLAQLTERLLAAGERVLITANTNVAVDRLVGATLDVLGSPRRPPLLRLGRIGPALRGRGASVEEALLASEGFPALMARFVAALTAAGLETRGAERVEGVLRLARRAAASREALAEELSGPALEEVSALADRILAALAALDAPALAATLCGTWTLSELRSRRFDTVIVDEASMAAVAHVAAAGGLARRRIVIGGDFLQLPPIALADTPEARVHLGQHLFAFAGCDDPITDHPLRSLLREQWRMHPQVRQAVSRVFYGDRLVDAPGLARRGERGGGLLLVDTHGSRPVAHRTAPRSQLNLVHARLIAAWLTGSRWETIGVIAPYRAQARLIRGLLRRSCRARLQDGSIQVSTVHRFQGEERDLIVFDTTSAPGPAGAQFLSDVRNPAAPSLINVAISRARHALLLVGDVPWLRAALGAGSSLGRVLGEALRAQEEIDLCDPADPAELARLDAFLRRDGAGELA